MSYSTRCWARGLSISVTGFERVERRGIQDLLEKEGAEYVPYLNKRCTHLIVSGTCTGIPSKKLAIALQNQAKWKTRLVTLEWVLQSSAAGMRLDELEFWYNTSSHSENHHQIGNMDQSGSLCEERELENHNGTRHQTSQAFDARGVSRSICSQETPQLHCEQTRGTGSATAAATGINDLITKLLVLQAKAAGHLDPEQIFWPGELPRQGQESFPAHHQRPKQDPLHKCQRDASVHPAESMCLTATETSLIAGPQHQDSLSVVRLTELREYCRSAGQVRTCGGDDNSRMLLGSSALRDAAHLCPNRAREPLLVAASQHHGVLDGERASIKLSQFPKAQPQKSTIGGSVAHSMKSFDIAGSRHIGILPPRPSSRVQDTAAHQQLSDPFGNPSLRSSSETGRPPLVAVPWQPTACAKPQVNEIEAATFRKQTSHAPSKLRKCSLDDETGHHIKDGNMPVKKRLSMDVAMEKPAFHRPDLKENGGAFLAGSLGPNSDRPAFVRTEPVSFRPSNVETNCDIGHYRVAEAVDKKITCNSQEIQQQQDEAIVGKGRAMHPRALSVGVDFHAMCSATIDEIAQAKGNTTASEEPKWMDQPSSNGSTPSSASEPGLFIRNPSDCTPPFSGHGHGQEVDDVNSCLQCSGPSQGILRGRESGGRMTHISPTPASILMDVLWAVDQPLHEALIVRTGEPSETLEDKRTIAEDDSGFPAGSVLFDGDWDAVVYPAAQPMTILFPCGAGPQTIIERRCYEGKRAGVTRRQLVAHIQEFYREEVVIAGNIYPDTVPITDLSSTLESNTGIYSSCPRSKLLQQDTAIQGLFRLSKDPLGTVYLLKLGA